MTRTAAEALLDVLEDWDVKVIFGLPGDGINGIMAALRERQDSLQFVQVRHEEAAAFMACAYAKYTGRLGVCLATSGPGAINLLTGLYDAKMDGQPVLAITGMPFHDLIGTATQQDVETDKLFSDVAALSLRVMGPTHVEPVTDQACRTAIGRRTVAHIAFPIDLQTASVDAPRSKRNVAGHTSGEPAQPAAAPSQEELTAAAAILNAGTKVAILAGRGALGASAELLAVAEKLGAPIVKPLLGKGAIPDASPYTTGGIGLLGTPPSADVMEECDTLLMVGTGFPYIEFLPKPGQARTLQIDIAPERIGLRCPVECAVVGDSQTVLSRLLPLLQTKPDRSFLEGAQSSMAGWRDLLAKQAAVRSKPMKPQAVTAAISRHLSPDAIVSLDSGLCTVWGARFLEAQPGQMYSVSGTLASMACALPYAMAAQIAYPGRQCVAIAGDGGFSMLMAEFVNCVKYGLPVKVFVYRNDSYGMIKWEQLTTTGTPEFGCELQPIDFALFAEACGARGIRVEDPDDLDSTVQAALAHDGPCLVECLVDPLEPPLPPRVTKDQIVNLTNALLHGQPDRAKIMIQVAASKARELL